MTHVVADRIKETTSTTGTGTFTLTGAASGFRTFASQMSTSDTIWYCAVNGSEWEVGMGTLASSSTLARTTVLSSSTGSAVNFTAAPTVFGTLPAAAPLGKTKEVVSVTKSDTFSSATTATWTDITGVAAATTTTPAMISTDKVLVTVSLSISTSTAADRLVFRLTRNGTPIGLGDSAGSRLQVTAGFSGQDVAGMKTISFTFLDNPGATTAQTYQVQFNSLDSVGTFYVNRSSADDNAASRSRGISTITLQRVGA